MAWFLLVTDRLACSGRTFLQVQLLTYRGRPNTKEGLLAWAFRLQDGSEHIWKVLTKTITNCSQPNLGWRICLPAEPQRLRIFLELLLVSCYHFCDTGDRTAYLARAQGVPSALSKAPHCRGRRLASWNPTGAILKGLLVIATENPQEMPASEQLCLPIVPSDLAMSRPTPI